MVWVEWKYYTGDSGEEVDQSDHSSNSETDDQLGPPPFVMRRVSRLAMLLADTKKPAEFLVPHCLGHVHDDCRSRPGLVFNNQFGDSHPPCTLLSFLSKIEKPSLSCRVRLMGMITSLIWYLHATNWLHKGLRSENVVFFPPGHGEIDARAIRDLDPVICGFDYSRPSSIGEETERPLQNLRHDLYRHPKVQFDVPREGRSGFQKLHDIYSLGVVLYEIALWQPVHVALCFHDVSKIKASTVKSVRGRLLEPYSRDMIGSEVGHIIASAITACLDGDQTLMPDTNILHGAASGANGPDGDARLQFAFFGEVLKKLDLVVI